jgi:hypothetical protein
MSENFARVVVIDFEYQTVPPGSLPRILCMVAYELDEKLRHKRTIRLWRGEFGSQPPFDVGENALVVAYSAWAEMTCFQVLGWKFPVHIYDLHTAYLAATNFLLPKVYGAPRRKESKKLADACRAYGIDGWENIDKPMIAKDIGEGRWQKYGREVIFQYCEEDVRNSAELLRRQLRPSNYSGLAPANVELVLNWSEYSAKVIAQVQARGMRIDMPIWQLVQENKAAVIRELVRRFDPSQGSSDPIYTLDGEFEYARFARYLIDRRIAWPRLPSGQLDLDKEAFELMAHVPGMDGIHALRTSLRLISSANLPIGPDGINRPSLFPFGTTTGRNAHCRSLFNCHAAMRSFIRFPPDKYGLYLDFRTQEIGVAAVRSGDEGLKASYAGGDVYHGFALDAGMTDERDLARWKATNPQMRERMKSLYLAIGYGMGVPNLARKLDRHPLIASGLLELHRRKYPRFWQWREQQVQQAMLTRRMEADDGWPLLITESPNKNTLYNFPAQSGGAVMLRLAAVRLCEAGLVPSMLIHDGILFELDGREQIEQAKAIMAAAGAEACGGFPIGVGVEQLLEGGARFRDKRPVARAMWQAMVDVLEAVGAIKKDTAA